MPANDETVTLSIFPALQGKKARYIDMNDCARRGKKQPARSRYLNADLTDRALRRLHRRWGVATSFGGYLEDRKDLWRGSYLNPATAVHLAIDINVRADTELTVKYPARVEKIVHDPEQNGGWGGVIFFRLDKPIGKISHFLYAHIAKGSAKVGEGAAVRPGEVVATIGRCHENGGWYEHLHVQALTQEAWDKFGGDLSKFDGYGAQPAGKEHPYFPDPMGLL
jgi:hypothetical protein